MYLKYNIEYIYCRHSHFAFIIVDMYDVNKLVCTVNIVFTIGYEVIIRYRHTFNAYIEH